MRTFFTVVLSLLLSLQQVSAQKAPSLKSADVFFARRQFADALPIYIQLLNSDSSNPILNYRIGYCYINSRSMKGKALQYLEKARAGYEIIFSEKNNSIPFGLYSCLGDTYQQNYEFDKAKLNYEKAKAILEASPSKNQFAIEEMNSRLDVCRVGKSLNGLSSETIRKKEKTTKAALINSANMSKKLSENVKKPLKEGDEKYFVNVKDALPLLNDTLTKEKKNKNETTVATSFDGQVILNYRDEQGSANLYTTRLRGNSWTVPEKLIKPVNTAGWEDGEWVSADGRSLYFVSDRKGGYGGKDIYVSQKTEKGEWDKAENLGPSINTPYDEEAPFIHPDGVTFYFSSNGGPIPGHYGIYTSTLSSAGWSAPVSTGFPIDTTHDFVKVDSSGHISSLDKKRTKKKKKKQSGEIDSGDNFLISFNGPAGTPLTMMKGQLRDENGKPQGTTRISVIDNQDVELKEVFFSDSTKESYSLILPPGKNNNVIFKREGYIPVSENVDLTAKTDLFVSREEVKLVPVKEGSVAVLNNIVFNPGKELVRPTSDVALNELVSVLKSNPQMVVEINNVIVAKKDIKENSRLARERAATLTDYLVSCGIRKEQVTANGSAMKIRHSPAKKAGEWTELKILEHVPEKKALTTQ